LQNNFVNNSTRRNQICKFNDVASQKAIEIAQHSYRYPIVRETLTGSRIRERRIMAGLRQADLARSVGISASYLNLIEHNRRKIGGKLLVEIAQALEVEPSLLSEGAGEALVASLGETAAQAEANNAETDRAEELARRFPGWSELLVQQQRRIATLERRVEALTDRLTHDPQLATSLHEVLSTAAAVRSVASILAEPGDLDPTWRDRFTRNLNDDSLRLAQSSKALVAYLDATETGADRKALPREEAEAVFAEAGYVFDALERPGAHVRDAQAMLSQPSSGAARKILAAMLAQYLRDAEAMPRTAFLKAAAASDHDPMVLAQEFRVPLAAVMRRLAVMPEGALPFACGLVICDAAGSILFQKPVGGFTVPRTVAPCPLWPLFLALHRPRLPVAQRITQVGRGPEEYDCLAISAVRADTEYAPQPRIEATMLMRPATGPAAEGANTLSVGTSCRVCSREKCVARREPSLLQGEPR
jgi:predicted transcriptional regulator/DNA-binding XRE family transcriptional regulator